jgi:hypothetical protein
VTGQTIGTLNSIDSKFVNPLKIPEFLCQSCCVTTPEQPKPRLL